MCAARMVRLALMVAATGAATACAGFWTTPEQRAHMRGTPEYRARMAQIDLLRGAISASAPGEPATPYFHENPIFNLTVRDGLLFRSRESLTPIAVISGTAVHNGPLIP